MILPGRAAGQVRKAAADIMVRYLGGDPTLVEEVADFASGRRSWTRTTLRASLGRPLSRKP